MSSPFPRAAVLSLIAQHSGVDASCVIWDGDAIPYVVNAAGGAPGALVSVTLSNFGEQGADEYRRTFIPGTPGNNQLAINGMRTANLTVAVESYSKTTAHDTLETIRQRMWRPVSRAALRAVNVALNSYLPIIDLTRSEDNRFVYYSRMDILIGYVAIDIDTTDAGDWIDLVNGVNKPLVPGTLT